MATKYEIVEIDKNEVMVDVSLLRKTEQMFFNATKMAKPFGKKVVEFLRIKPTQEYIQIVLEDINSKGDQGHHWKYEDLVKITKGRYGGTYLHNELAFEFAGWLSPIFRRNLHKWAQERIEKERSWKTKRLEAKTGFLPMTAAVMKNHDPVKFYHYSTEADLINRIVLGMSAKQYKKEHNVDNVRDAVCAAELSEINRLQIINTGLIEIGMPYAERKEHLIRCHNKELALSE